MKIVTNKPVAQGDMLIIPIAAIPANVKPGNMKGNHFVLAHSETGHDHVIERSKAEVYESASDEFVAYIRAISDAEISHQRDFHTHESLLLTGGQNYEVRRQREYVPEGFRRAQD